MTADKKMLIAFILNLSFSVFEFFGGIFTGSTAIMSDALHDTGDAISIGLSLFLEKKSMKAPDSRYTFGYRRYSVTGGLITTLILLIGSVFVIANAVKRIITPSPLNYDGMIAFALIGTAVNLLAAYLTRSEDSVNHKAVNLHMIEDVLGWITVLIGAAVMKFTDLTVIDPIMSIGVALFIIYNSIGNLKEISVLFNMKAPDGLSADEISEAVSAIDGIEDVHHIHLWSMDSDMHYASMHIVTDEDTCEIKNTVREKLHKYGIGHITIETERSTDICSEKNCAVNSHGHRHCHGHHH